MMIKLNKNQIEYLLTTWFTPYEAVQIFDSSNLDWLKKQKFEVDISRDWPIVYVNGYRYTTINCDGVNKDKMNKLISFGGK